MFICLLQMLFKSFDTVDRGILDSALGRLGCLVGLGMFTFLTMLMSGLGSNSPLDLVRPGLEMVVFLRVAP